MPKNPLDSLMATYEKVADTEKKQGIYKTLLVDNGPDVAPSLALEERDGRILEFYLLGDIGLRLKRCTNSTNIGSNNISFGADEPLVINSEAEKRALALAIGQGLKFIAAKLKDEFGVETMPRNLFEDLYDLNK